MILFFFFVEDEDFFILLVALESRCVVVSRSWVCGAFELLGVRRVLRGVFCIMFLFSGLSGGLV